MTKITNACLVAILLSLTALTVKMAYEAVTLSSEEWRGHVDD